MLIEHVITLTNERNMCFITWPFSAHIPFNT